MVHQRESRTESPGVGTLQVDGVRWEGCVHLSQPEDTPASEGVGTTPTVPVVL